jgi:hypothetical protein
MNDLALFDVKGYLESKGIAYATSGENISPGWIGINCPYCGDTKNHFGINLRNKLYSCWRCGNRGNPFTLVRLLEQTDDSRIVHNILKQFISAVIEFPDIEYPVDLNLPPEFISLWDWYQTTKEYTKEQFAEHNELMAPVQAINYLNLRGFDFMTHSKQYKLMWSGILGKWSFRIIIPVFMNGRMVNFAGRAVCGQEPTYKNCPNARAPMPINDTLYGYDDFGEGEHITLVEGPLDKWKLGNKAMATFGLVLTNAQAALLFAKKPRKITFIYDADVAEDREKLKVVDKSIGKIWFCETETFILDNGDPGDLTWPEANKLMEDIWNG